MTMDVPHACVLQLRLYKAMYGHTNVPQHGESCQKSKLPKPASNETILGENSSSRNEQPKLYEPTSNVTALGEEASSRYENTLEGDAWSEFHSCHGRRAIIMTCHAMYLNTALCQCM
jgi:hypothetical protein